MQKNLPASVPSSTGEEKFGEAIIELYRQSRLGFDRDAEYIFGKFTEYSRRDANLKRVAKGNSEFELHDLDGQQLDLELREHLHHLTIGRFIELVLQNSIKAKQSAAAIKRHQEHYAMKVDVFSWLDVNMHTFKSMDATAEAIAGKIVPLAFRTVRKWVKEYKDMQSAGRV